MDLCMSYFQQLDVLLESYEEIPLSEFIFEAEDPEVAEKTASNAAVEEKSMNILQKISKTVRGIFQNIKDMINHILGWFKLDKTEKDGFKKFAEECKKNPEFRGKTVTLHDYRKINEEREKLLSQAEKKYKALKDEEIENKPDIMKDIQRELQKVGAQASSIAKNAGAKFTTETALKYARTCQNNAIKVQMMIDFDMGLLDSLEKEMSKKDIKKFKRKVRMLSSRWKVIRWIAGGREDQSATLRSTLGEISKALRGNFHSGSDAYRQSMDTSSMTDDDRKSFEKDVRKMRRKESREARKEVAGFVRGNKGIKAAAKLGAKAGLKAGEIGKDAALGAAAEAQNIKQQNREVKKAYERKQREDKYRRY